MELAGKIALVTGAGSGIGRASAMRLAEEGADVAVLSRTAEEVEQVALDIRKLGRRAIWLVADVADADDMAEACRRTLAELGAIDIVVANAGVNGVWAPIHELEPAEWDSTIAINLRGTFLTLRYAVPAMLGRGGSIVIVSSINGTRTFTTAGASAYATAKAGQLALGQMTALELAKHRIRVNVICPGAIDTEIDANTATRNRESAAVPAEFPSGQIPLTGDRPGTSAEVAELVLFLASDRARHITGTPVWIDGGQSLLV
ncbi:NAD(P)-dependent dehydrogenase (short-subunit alcohol dehydrogenase family) [Kaistia hirudinis]|uniref:NAD(P)-dependent dehydrogenase (Short-subunit alcohol dehydrogenase family) n=1 Tax=Kaistia hirudinis TaxID=1293440 RepID=A0A840AS32_9HYPH|nr:SDR family NAD(P)-dependent oxidoreductase [Kaistia hirudinis]MBB3932462.1 NAD(P)-dependent dehydrogenase (short-subunit alcohol dehydrogenase family) [Kaistia hirudinis]